MALCAAHKADDGEGANMVVMPCWHGSNHPLGRTDGALPSLVDFLLSHMTDVASSADSASAAKGSPAVAAGNRARKNGTMAEALAVAAKVDLRRLSADISSALAEAAARQLEEARTVGSLTAEQAAAAAAVLQAAVSGVAAVAAAAAVLGDELEDEEQLEDVGPADDALAGSPQQQEQQQQLSQRASSRQQQQEQQRRASLQQQQQPGQQQQQVVLGSKRPREEAATEPQQPPLTKKAAAQARAAQAEQRLKAAAHVVLAAAGAADAQSDCSGASRAQVNLYWSRDCEHMHHLVFNRTAKAAMKAAVAAKLVEPADGGSAASGEARVRLTAAGLAAAPPEQYITELEAYCRQFVDRAAFLAHVEACHQQIGAQAPAGEQPALAGGFFWEQQQQQQQQQGVATDAQGQQGQDAGAAPQAQQPHLQPPPGPAGADLASMQRALLLHAVRQLAARSGISMVRIEAQVVEQLQQRRPQLMLFGESDKLRRSARRALHKLLDRGLERCGEVNHSEVLCLVGCSEVLGIIARYV
jgi:hypothetical protein